MSAPTGLKFYFGHHKCASTWVNSILRKVCIDLGWTMSGYHNPRQFGHDLNADLHAKPRDLVSYINADEAQVSRIDLPYRGFHVIRDPRDVIVSSYFSSLNSHPTDQWPELAEHREKLKALSKDEGLLLEMDFIHDVMENMRSWNYGRPNVLELRFEDLTAHPYEGFLGILNFLGCLDDNRLSPAAWMGFTLQAGLRKRLRFLPMRDTIPAEILLAVVHRRNFRKLAAGREAGREDVRSHMRKGVAGDWKNHFTPEHKAAFRARYGDLPLKLGYEQDPAW